jgi:ribosomal protein RSM22 (predicted rRNA methylase)
MMDTLPEDLQEKLSSLLEGVSMKQLIPVSEKLSHFYRNQTGAFPLLQTKEEHLAYLTVRFPATFQAVRAVLQKLPFSPQSLLDLGAGPGTGLLAAQTLFDIQEASLVERDPLFIELGKKLCPPSHWIEEDLFEFQGKKAALVLFCYSII